MFDLEGLPIRNQIEVRRYSCICDECRKGEECTVDWAINNWERKDLVLKTRRNQPEIPPIDLPNDNLVLL